MISANIVSVERIKEYTELPTEAEWEGMDPRAKPPTAWPSEGEIELKDYKVRYRPGLELVLRGISCKIAPCEKVGIAGRTGNGPVYTGGPVGYGLIASILQLQYAN